MALQSFETYRANGRNDNFQFVALHMLISSVLVGLCHLCYQCVQALYSGISKVVQSGISKLQNTVYIVQWLPMCIKLFSHFLVINLPECITITSQIFQDVKVFSWQQQNCFISTYVRVESFTKNHTLHNAYILVQCNYELLRAQEVTKEGTTHKNNIIRA